MLAGIGKERIIVKTAVVTGANGFLGRGLVDQLCREDYMVYCIDICIDESAFENTANKVFIEHDLKYINEVDIPVKPDLFYHLAWEGVSTDYKNNMDVQMRNLGYSRGCFEYAQNIRTKKFVFLGSASEYAYSDKPIDGISVVPAPCDAYAAVKAMVHIQLELMSQQCGLPYVRILLPSIYGGQRNDANIITYTIKALLGGERPTFTKLEQIWEYVYVEDAVRALAQIGKRGISGRSYPVGWNQRIPLSDYIYMVRDSIDPKLELGVGERSYKTGKIDNCIMDTTQTIADTQYRPIVPFIDGIKTTIEYIKNN